MPEEEKKTVPIDTSGPDAEIDIEEQKDESVVETEAPKQETETTEKDTDKTIEVTKLIMVLFIIPPFNNYFLKEI